MFRSPQNLTFMRRSQLNNMLMLWSLLSLMLMSRFQLSLTSTLSQLLLMLPPLLMPDMLLPLFMLDMLVSLPFLGMLVSPLLMDMLVTGMLPPLDMLTKELANQAQKTHPWKLATTNDVMMLPHRTS